MIENILSLILLMLFGGALLILGIWVVLRFLED